MVSPNLTMSPSKYVDVRLWKPLNLFSEAMTKSLFVSLSNMYILPSLSSVPSPLADTNNL